MNDFSISEDEFYLRIDYVEHRIRARREGFVPMTLEQFQHLVALIKEL